MRYDRRKRYSRNTNLSVHRKVEIIFMNKTIKQQRESGFTIIEVVLVLAIAALIMLMVFLALPALQRSQRDTQRKDDISRLQSQVNTYKSTNRGQLPTDSDLSSDVFLAGYLRKDNDQFADPLGDNYQLIKLAGSNDVSFGDTKFTTNAYDTPENASIIYFRKGARCDNGKITGGNDTARSIIFAKGLEGGGVQCVQA